MNLVNDYIIEDEIIGGDVLPELPDYIVTEQVVDAKEIFKYIDEQRNKKDKVSK